MPRDPIRDMLAASLERNASYTDAGAWWHGASAVMEDLTKAKYKIVLDAVPVDAEKARWRDALEIIAGKSEWAPEAIGVSPKNIALLALAPSAKSYQTQFVNDSPSEHRVIPAMRNGLLRHPPTCVNCGQPIECPSAEWQHVAPSEPD
jgi:hypothetical protein